MNNPVVIAVELLAGQRLQAIQVPGEASVVTRRVRGIFRGGGGLRF